VQSIQERQRSAFMVAHNMRVPPPDPKYIKAITTNPDLETVFLNMHSAGIAVTLKKR
jgi:hypothetical protein